MAPVLRPGVLFLFLCLALVGRASADPIVVTGGGTFLYWDGGFTSVSLLGDGLRVTTDGRGGGAWIFPSGSAQLDGTFLVSNNASAPHEWSVMVDGVEYSAYLEGSVTFETGSIAIPPAVRGDQARFQTGFTMAGHLRGTTAPFGGGAVLFDLQLTGAGTATADGFAVDTNLFRFGGTRYDFTDVAPTPEPATMLLMGTGLAGLMLRRRRRKASEQPH